jgi:hypothetical protein
MTGTGQRAIFLIDINPVKSLLCGCFRRPIDSTATESLLAAATCY